MGPLMVEDVAGAARWFAWSLQPELPREAVSVAVVPAEARLVVTVAGARGRRWRPCGRGWRRCCP